MRGKAGKSVLGQLFDACFDAVPYRRRGDTPFVVPIARGEHQRPPIEFTAFDPLQVAIKLVRAANVDSRIQARGQRFVRTCITYNIRLRVGAMPLSLVHNAIGTQCHCHCKCVHAEPVGFIGWCCCNFLAAVLDRS